MYEIFKYGNIFAFLVGYQLRGYFLSICIGWLNFPTKLTGGEEKFCVWLQVWTSKFCFQIHSVSLKIGLRLRRGEGKNIFWFEFYEAILGYRFSLKMRLNTVCMSAQALGNGTKFSFFVALLRKSEIFFYPNLFREIPKTLIFKFLKEKGKRKNERK